MNETLLAHGIHKNFGSRCVIQSLDMSIQEGEFVVLIGPSGSGKTTWLRIIAGLIQADSGELSLHGEMVDSPKNKVFIPADRRRGGMVFQSYALWPHLKAVDNVGVVLKLKGAERKKEAMKWLEAVGLGEFADCYPQQLSGGQQQRVGIARALATRPRLLLLDEPLSSLDIQTRENLRVEIRRIAKQHKVTAILVSHDPSDAWQLADRVAVLEDGAIVQYDRPEELFHRPASALVAKFTGAQEVARGRVDQRGFVVRDNSIIGVKENLGAAQSDARLYVRPDGVKRGQAEGGLLAKIIHAAFEAGRYRCYWRVDGFEFPLVSYEPKFPPSVASLSIDPEHAFVF